MLRRTIMIRETRPGLARRLLKTIRARTQEAEQEIFSVLHVEQTSDRRWPICNFRPSAPFAPSESSAFYFRRSPNHSIGVSRKGSTNSHGISAEVVEQMLERNVAASVTDRSLRAEWSGNIHRCPISPLGFEGSDFLPCHHEIHTPAGVSAS